jgi:hypothetical protein
MQYKNPSNKALVEEGLKALNAMNLSGLLLGGGKDSSGKGRFREKHGPARAGRRGKEK